MSHSDSEIHNKTNCIVSIGLIDLLITLFVHFI